MHDAEGTIAGYCPSCGHPHAEGQAFCGSCGASLPAVAGAGGPAVVVQPGYEVPGYLTGTVSFYEDRSFVSWHCARSVCVFACVYG